MYVVFPVFIGRRCTSEGTSLDQNQLRACGGNGQARGPIDGRLFRASNNRLGLALLELGHRNEPVSGSGLLRRLGLGWSTIIDSLRKAARKREIERDIEREREREIWFAGTTPSGSKSAATVVAIDRRSRRSHHRSGNRRARDRSPMNNALHFCKLIKGNRFAGSFLSSRTTRKRHEIGRRRRWWRLGPSLWKLSMKLASCREHLIKVRVGDQRCSGPSTVLVKKNSSSLTDGLVRATFPSA